MSDSERLPFHFSLSCIGEGNGNPLQCSCLENLRDGGAWWAAISGVAQSQTRLKRLSSRSSSSSPYSLLGRFQLGFEKIKTCFSNVSGIFLSIIIQNPKLLPRLRCQSTLQVKHTVTQVSKIFKYLLNFSPKIKNSKCYCNFL